MLHAPTSVGSKLLHDICGRCEFHEVESGAWQAAELIERIADESHFVANRTNPPLRSVSYGRSNGGRHQTKRIRCVLTYDGKCRRLARWTQGFSRSRTTMRYSKRVRDCRTFGLIETHEDEENTIAAKPASKISSRILQRIALLTNVCCNACSCGAGDFDRIASHPEPDPIGEGILGRVLVSSPCSCGILITHDSSSGVARLFEDCAAFVSARKIVAAIGLASGRSI